MKTRLVKGRLIPPRSIREARDLHQQLRHELTRLEQAIGVEAPTTAYHDPTWEERARKRAIYLREEIRQADAWLEENANPKRLLRDAYEVLKGVELRMPLHLSEHAVMVRLDDYFFTEGREAARGRGGCTDPGCHGECHTVEHTEREEA